MSDDDRRPFVNNSSGRNQFSDRPILEDIPDLPERLQKYINQGVFQREIPARLQKDCGKVVSLSYIKKAMKRFQIKTVRRSGLTDVEKGAAILSVLEQDPLGRLGGRSIKEKLALTGVHASRDFTIQFAKAENPVQAANRHPGTRKVHKHGIWSSGPNEEWCVDGHEKIALSMGISVYGIVDKYSRMELALFAVPNARHSRVPVLVYLRTVQKLGGMPLSSTSDKGSELGPLISLVQTLRKRYQPHISEEKVPSHSAVKSPQNVTRERSWRPLWEKHLANILHFYRIGQSDAGYQSNDDFHSGLARWLWAKIVQKQLDELLLEHQVHRVRYQAKILLPSGTRRIDMYSSPEDYGGMDKLIKIPAEDIDRLLAQWEDQSLFRFGTRDEAENYENLYQSIARNRLQV
ncbi:hypothetical protein D9611_004975 [Ephemerocybe angulata]|uniref:Integrase catalytic domain-containing protein n=1 Tax=Ephemerocybe angulata TaxID=980116 RepID=A0A8H5EWX9_9AGAR|nr:hypothetical protein D9611_004975 [Tulosesus angulatus]